jgi:hypothetical protein
VEKQLLSRGEDELTSAVDTFQNSIGKLHRGVPPEPRLCCRDDRPALAS